MVKLTQTLFVSGDDRLVISRVGSRGQIEVNGKTITLGLDDLSDLFEEVHDLRNAIRDNEDDLPF